MQLHKTLLLERNHKVVRIFLQNGNFSKTGELFGLSATRISGIVSKFRWYAMHPALIRIIGVTDVFGGTKAEILAHKVELLRLLDLLSNAEALNEAVEQWDSKWIR